MSAARSIRSGSGAMAAPTGSPTAPPTKSLAGQTAMITGAGRGIGRAIAIRFAAAGAAVVCCARSQETVDATIASVRHDGGDGFAVRADVRVPEAMAALAQAAVDRFGHLDLAILNAGVNPAHTRIDRIAPDVWRECVETNLSGVFHGLRAVVPHMRAAGGGRVLVLGAAAW
ncbi:MAG: SDR family NAD(P)-dependent oxidoreductase, partial [Solirubrobacteraceae bacterium]